MTCRAMVEQMLEADLAELTGSGGTNVARHLTECPKCRAVAARLLRDTRTLARSVLPVRMEPVVAPPRRRRHAGHVARSTAFAGIAASLVIMAVQARRRVDPPPSPPTVVMHPVTVVAPAATVTASVQVSRLSAIANDSRRTTLRHVLPFDRTTRPLRREIAHAVVPVAVTVEATRVTPAQHAVPVTPVRLDGTPKPPLGNRVAVEPSAGKRASIIRTDHPGVTVVWLYD